MNGSLPSEARDRVLAQLPVEKRIDIIQRTEKRGPSADDPDWLLIETMMACAARIEAAAPVTEKTLAMLVERLERVEQGVDNLAKQPAIPADMASSMAKLAEQLRCASSQRTDPFANVTRYFGAFWVGVIVCEMIFAALYYRVLPPIFDAVGMFAVGISATAFTLLWMALWPMLKKARRGY